MPPEEKKGPSRLTCNGKEKREEGGPNGGEASATKEMLVDDQKKKPAWRGSERGGMAATARQGQIEMKVQGTKQWKKRGRK